MQLFDRARAAQLMADRGIDVLLASSKPAVGYLSDFWDDDTREDYAMWYPHVTYATLCGVPADPNQDPFLVLSAHEKTSAEAANPWIADRRYWGPGFYVQQWPTSHPDAGDPMEQVAEALHDRGLASGCIAIEQRYLATEYFERLRALVPEATFTDAREVLVTLRAIKHPEEIDRLRTVCARTASAWREVMRDHLAPNVTELELRWRFTEAFARHQLGWERGYIIFGPAGVRLQFGAPVPGARTLREGYFVRADIVGRYRGYLSDMSRVIGFGEVSPAMHRAHAMVRGFLDELTRLIRPGTTYAQVRARELELYAEAGVKPVVPYAAHSIGRSVHEAPYAAADDETALAPGMVIALEPTITFTQGGDFNLCLEDDLLVTETGCLRLTAAAPLDLYPDLT